MHALITFSIFQDGEHEFFLCGLNFIFSLTLDQLRWNNYLKVNVPYIIIDLFIFFYTSLHIELCLVWVALGRLSVISTGHSDVTWHRLSYQKHHFEFRFRMFWERHAPFRSVWMFEINKPNLASIGTFRVTLVLSLPTPLRASVFSKVGQRQEENRGKIWDILFEISVRNRLMYQVFFQKLMFESHISEF